MIWRSALTTKSLRDRLLPKVSANAETGCWDWTGSKYDTGYGQFYVRGKHYKAHRVSYELHCQEIPTGLQVLHRCDNRGCVNPDHLFLGTHADNMADKVAKGRQARTSLPGDFNGRAKVTSLDVAEIRSATGVSQQILAKRYGISPCQISLILSGKRW
jgi:hypothetical protein